jgi:hypothetical protein
VVAHLACAQWALETVRVLETGLSSLGLLLLVNISDVAMGGGIWWSSSVTWRWASGPASSTMVMKRGAGVGSWVELAGVVATASWLGWY